MTHDGREMWTKNGKSFVVNFFPRTEPFRHEVEAWIAFLRDLGFQRDDALFPDLKALTPTWPGGVREPMQSKRAVADAFRRACLTSDRKYSPHAARHTLAHLGYQLSRSPEQLKAWTQNLGHASVDTAWEHYGKISEARQNEIFEAFETDTPATSRKTELMLDYHEHRLIPGTPEFDLAEALVYNRMDRLRRTSRRSGT